MSIDHPLGDCRDLPQLEGEGGGDALSPGMGTAIGPVTKFPLVGEAPNACTASRCDAPASQLTMSVEGGRYLQTRYGKKAQEEDSV